MRNLADRSLFIVVNSSILEGLRSELLSAPRTLQVLAINSPALCKLNLRVAVWASGHKQCKNLIEIQLAASRYLVHHFSSTYRLGHKEETLTFASAVGEAGCGGSPARDPGLTCLGNALGVVDGCRCTLRWWPPSVNSDRVQRSCGCIEW
jgi:hypothetical protein